MNKTGHIVIVAENDQVLQELKTRHPTLTFTVFDDTKNALLWLESDSNHCNAILLGEQLPFIKSELLAELLAEEHPTLKDCIKIYNNAAGDAHFAPWPDRQRLSKRAKRSTLKTTLRRLLEKPCPSTALTPAF